MRYPLLAALALFALGAAPAAPVKMTPRSPAARDALDKYAADRVEAKNTYDKALATATNDVVAALQKAKTDTMKAGNLDEANRIEAAITDIKTAASSSKKPSIAGDYLYNSRRVTDEFLTLRPNGSIYGDGHDWKMVWRLRDDGCLELSENATKIVMVKTADGWAGSDVSNHAPVVLTQK